MKKLFTIFIFSVILINAIFAASKKIQLEEADKGEDLTITVQEKSEADSDTYTLTLKKDKTYRLDFEGGAWERVK